MRSLLLNWENPLSFDESVVQVIKGENKLMSMKISLPIESCAFWLKNNAAPTHGQSSNTR